MTNKEKFIEVFGLEPSEHFCPLSEEISCGSCPYNENGCDDKHKDRFFSMEYKEPTTKNDLGVDCIDRQATLDAIIKRLGIKNEKYLLEAERAIYQQVLAMPPVTPQTRKGHWISHREHCENLGVMPSGLGAYEWCSNCDCGIDVREWHRNHYNFCPNCGCAMVEPQEIEE